jgi:hypothetical protein
VLSQQPEIIASSNSATAKITGLDDFALAFRR